MTDNQSTSNKFKVVLALKNTSSEKYNIEELYGQLTISNFSQKFNLPLREPLMMDSEMVSSSTPFTLEIHQKDSDALIGSLTISIPAKVDRGEEVDIEDQFQILNKSGGLVLKGRYFIFVLTRGVPKPVTSSLSSQNLVESQIIEVPNSFEKSSGNTTNLNILTPEKQKNLIGGSIATSSKTTKQSKVSSMGKSNTGSQKAQKLKKQNLNMAMTKSLERSVLNVGKKLEEDKNAISECVYLNKVCNKEVRLEDAASEPRGIEEEIKEFVPDKKDLSNYKEIYDLSPDKLRVRYSEGNKMRSNSPDKSFLDKSMRSSSPKGNLNADHLLIESEGWKKAEELKNQVDYLKMIVFSLDSKCKEMSNLEREIELLRIELSKSEESRKEMHESIKETSEEFKLESFNTQKLFAKLVAEKTAAEEKLKEFLKRFEEEQDKNEKLKVRTSKLESENAEANIRLKNFNEMVIQVKNFKKELENTEKRNEEMQDLFNQRIKDHQEAIKKLEEQKDLFLREKLALMNELHETKELLTIEQKQNLETNNEVENLKRKIQMLQSSESILKTSLNQKKSIEKDSVDLRNSIESTNNLIENVKSELIKKQKDFETMEKSFNDQLIVSQKKLNAAELKINEQSTQIANLTKQNSDFKNSVASLEQALIVKNDLNTQLEVSNQKFEQLRKDFNANKETNKTLSDQIVDQEGRILDLQNTITQLKNVLGDREEYIVNLKKLILEMREKGGAYIPFKDDPVDRKVADFINSLNDPNKMKIMFIREGNGVYQFGTKRINVKVEQDKVMIRIGGGYMSIEEFLETYTAAEIEKLSRNDPIKVLSKNIAVNKTIAGRCVKELEKSKTTQFSPRSLAPLFSKSDGNN